MGGRYAGNSYEGDVVHSEIMELMEQGGRNQCDLVVKLQLLVSELE